MGWILVGVVVAASLVAFVAFRIGDRRRREEGGTPGPRPHRSIGEALRQAQGRNARVLILFVLKAEIQEQLGRLFDPGRTLAKAVEQRRLFYVQVVSDPKEGEVARTLYEKYAKKPLSCSSVVVLDHQGALISSKELEDPSQVVGLEAWISRQL